jgi:nicotinamidase-related amidase
MDIDLSLSQAALLVLDLQELFTSAEGPFKNTGAGELIFHVNTFVKECEKLELPIIYSRYLFRDDLADAGLLTENPLVQEGCFCASSVWMQLDHRLYRSETRIDLQRNRPGAFWDGGLEQTLADHRIDTLLLCGLSINNAISTTARDAFARDIQVVVVK